jgi:1-acyl-sn-glycerol-3-phosphate acyltransferase
MFASLTAAGPVDELGVDESYSDRVHDVLRPLCRAWFGIEPRTEIGEVDFDGPCLLLFNRGTHPLPVDPLVLWTFFREHAGRAGRRVYALADPDTIAWPFIGDRLQRLGVFAASRGNCRVLLERGATVIAFPEGARARAKTYERRYRLERFDDGFLVETAMSCGARIVPGAVVGNEESFPLIARAAGLPVSPLFPLMGPLGLLPLPVTWRIRVAPPVRYADDPDQAERAAVVLDAARARMQELLVELLARRRTLFTG